MALNEMEQTSQKGRADLWTLFITGTRENLEDCLSYLIWFKKTLLLANRKRKPQNGTSWDEGTTGWDEKKTGYETKAASCDETGALGKTTEVHKETRAILKLKWFLSQPLHTHTFRITWENRRKWYDMNPTNEGDGNQELQIPRRKLDSLE